MFGRVTRGRQTSVQVASVGRVARMVEVAVGGRGGWGGVLVRSAGFATKKGKKKQKMSTKGKKGNKGDEEKRVLLGRPGNHVQIGLVGLPNVGKSSIFNSLCNMSIPSENFPFCTKEPNYSRVAVPDPRFDELVKLWKPKKSAQAYLHVTDIAGLIKGAADGEGLGNEFLSNIKATDAIYHVVRIFDDDEVIHVENSIDPVRDLEIITNELMAKDMEWATGELERVEKAARGAKEGPKKEQLDMITHIVEHLESGSGIRFGDWSAAEVDYLNQLQFLTAKPVIYLLNLSSKHYVKRKNKWLGKVAAWIKENSDGEPIIPLSADLEQTLQGMSSQEERDEYLAGLGEGIVSAMDKVILTGYHTLRMQHFYTTGSDEVKCWTIREGTKAPGAAGVIHTDFESHFISADIYNYADLEEHGSERDVKAAGKCRMEGKNYVMKDGDIAFFKHNAGGKKKKK